jgi:ribonucleoside-diphosphate reductase alpha chain
MVSENPIPSTRQLTENAKQVLEARYLRKDAMGVPLESVEGMFWRVAVEIAAVDSQYRDHDPSRSAEEFFDLMCRLEFIPNSPTLMNAGREQRQLSACFVLPVEDSLESIFETVKNTAMIHKSGGGTGFCFSRIRPKGDQVRSTQGVSSGPASFIRVFDAATEAVKQGGTRRGANMGVLRVDHPDILEFIDLKADGTALKNFNISVAVTDEFMACAEAGSGFDLLHPRTAASVRRIDARDLFRRICRRAWECGDPGILFLDRINRDNPTPDLGAIACTNPCGEQPLLPYESCNLGSVNLAKMACSSAGRTVVDYQCLARTVRTAVHFLDNVIDANQYPIPQIGEITRGNRKIGLGVMGWADLLIQLGIPYASDRALLLGEKIMGFVHRVAQRASRALAGQRGTFPNYKAGGEFRLSRRNATLTTVAPTGTISIIAGCSSGIEPLFALSYSRKHVLGDVELQEIHPGLMDRLSSLGILDSRLEQQVLSSGSVQQIACVPPELKHLYAAALEIAPEWHVRMQAAFQKHSDNAVSKTVNLPFEAIPEDVESVYRLAYRLGCKGITIYRDRCRNAQVLNVGCLACA